MRVLVTGRSGQLVRSLAEVAALMPDVELIAMGRPDFDLAKPQSIRPAILDARPDIVVSAAAYTAVDRAEDEPDLAYAVNVIGAAKVAEAAAELRVPIIHLSSDYVFSGDKPGPYREDDEARPRTIYGHTKLESERAVADSNPRHVILRTSWVYSPFGTNFVRTMLRLAADRESISVVSDQWGNPTSALDLADAVLRISAHPAMNHSGIYHFSGSGEINWSGFARHVFDISRKNGGPFAAVRDIVTADYPAKAQRPLNSRLANNKFEKTFGWSAPDWQASVEIIVRRILHTDYLRRVPEDQLHIGGQG